MKVCLDLHDASILRTPYDLLNRLKDRIPNLKVTLFWIPWDYATEVGTMRTLKADKLEQLRDMEDWVQIVPHGLTHMPREFEKADRKTMEDFINEVPKELEKQGIKIERGFCAPQWLWNQKVVDVLDENGWWGAVDRNQPDMLRPMKYYEYNKSLEENYKDFSGDLLKLHGHVDYTSINDLSRNFLHVAKSLPRDAEYIFASDCLDERQD